MITDLILEIVKDIEKSNNYIDSDNIAKFINSIDDCNSIQAEQSNIDIFISNDEKGDTKNE